MPGVRSSTPVLPLLVPAKLVAREVEITSPPIPHACPLQAPICDRPEVIRICSRAHYQSADWAAPAPRSGRVWVKPELRGRAMPRRDASGPPTHVRAARASRRLRRQTRQRRRQPAGPEGRVRARGGQPRLEAVAFLAVRPPEGRSLVVPHLCPQERRNPDNAGVLKYRYRIRTPPKSPSGNGFACKSAA